jgi:uncharacterized protein (DUF488 family)
MKIYTFGHSARSLADFQSALNSSKIDILIDLRKKPVSRYFPHFNRKNLEDTFKEKYLFGGDSLGGSPEFHNDLLEYIKNRGENKDHSKNRLFMLIDNDLKEIIFSKDPRFSNDEKRKFWITEKFLNKYISPELEQKATDFLRVLLEKNPDKNMCFFCSEKEPTHCHRYHLLEKIWIKKFPNIEVIHIEDIDKKSEVKDDKQTSLIDIR